MNPVIAEKFYPLLVHLYRLDLVPDYVNKRCGCLGWAYGSVFWYAEPCPTCGKLCWKWEVASTGAIRCFPFDSPLAVVGLFLVWTRERKREAKGANGGRRHGARHST